MSSGRTGLSLGRTFESEFPSNGIFAKIAFPSWDGKTLICAPGARKSEIFALVPSKVSAPTFDMCALIAANVSGVDVPSKRINVGKLKVFSSEKVAITSAAFVASAPFGKKEELLFS